MRSPRLGRAVLLAGIAVVFADSSIVVLAVPEVMGDFDAGVNGASWVITAYNLAVVVAGLALVRAVGRVAPARLAAGGFAVFAAASIGCAAAPSLALLVAFRSVQGLAAALVLVAALPLLGGTRAVRAWTLAATIGLAAGPALGGLLTEVFSWRSIFVVQAPLAALGLLAARRLAGEVEPSPGGPRPTRSWIADATLAALSGALVGALFLVVVLLINGFGWQPLPAALLATTLPVLAVVAERLAHGLSSRAAISGGALLVTLGLVVLAFLPGERPELVVAGLALCGAGLGLAAQPLGRLALGGPSLTRDAAWTVVARHAGLVLALVAVTPVLVASLTDFENDAEAVAGELVLGAPLPLRDKLPLIGELNRLGDAAETELPDFERTLAPYETGNGAAAGLGERLTSSLHDLVARAFRPAFLLCAGFGLLAAVLGLGLGGSVERRRARAPAAALVAAAVAAAGIALAADVRGGGLDDPAAAVDPCRRPPAFQGEGADAAVQRIALGALADAACELGTSRAALLRDLVGNGPSRVSSDRLAAAVRSGVLHTIDEERERGTIDGTVALVLRGLVAAAPLEWIRQILDGLTG